ncbi:o-succinylbenzoate--CoA ligase [Halostella salina]|uniref:o-succinylbenzoate--CoA ligase n=1 Tax=Halostella salina TaxID=1547897 RepID=UPI001F095620|nr:o-succinylbenzoate--CoA ligase [Halostella salina]
MTRQAESAPDTTAVVVHGSGESRTYAELDRAVDETAGRLAALGVGAGDHIGVLMDSRLAFVRLIHATARLGATLVPLNVRLTTAELDAQVDRVDLDLLVAERDTELTAIDAAGETPVASVDAPPDAAAVTDDRLAALADVDPDAVDPVARGLDDPACILSTSGTGGRPKPVVLTVGNLLANAAGSAFRLGVVPDDRWFDPLPMYHMGGLAPVVRSATYGTTVVVQREFDAAATADAIAERGATAVSLVPTMLRRMLDEREGLADSLRFVLLGGAPAPDALIERCADLGVPVCPTYGMTEAASQIATATPTEAVDHVGTVGRPLSMTEVTVVDDTGEPCPPGEPGELVVSGPTVTPGYYDDPETTAEAFCERGLRTGDVGYRDEDGRLWMHSRREDRIVTGGENVDPREVAGAIRDHPAVEDVAVVGLDDPEWGERVAALVVGDLSKRAVREFCAGRLAGFKHPKTVAFADEIPRTASGTVDRAAVRERLREAPGER